MNEKIETAMGIMDLAIAAFPKTKALWALYSGGHDSLVSTFLASKHPMFKGVIHVNTKTSPAAELVTRYARDVAKQNGWEFLEVSPFLTFAQIVAKNGFPSPTVHPMVYQYLKGRPLAQARKIAKGILLEELLPSNANDEVRKQLAKKVDVAFVSGIRRQESKARSNAPRFAKSEGVLWINPIIYFSKDECSELINQEGLQRNEVADRFGISGECDCGAHASKNEIEAKCKRMPLMDVYRNKIQQLATVARELQLLEVSAGMRESKSVMDVHNTIWGHGMKKKSYNTSPDQMPLFSICADCDNVYSQDGDLGIDPDIEMLMYKDLSNE